MARKAQNVRQLPVGLRAHQDRYVKTEAATRGVSEADVVREALDRMLSAEGHSCQRRGVETECPACGGTGGQV